jgi:hypothetical protein
LLREYPVLLVGNIAGKCRKTGINGLENRRFANEKYQNTLFLAIIREYKGETGSQWTGSSANT